MKTNHDGACAIYSPLNNGSPEDGICTCGYALQQARLEDYSEIYSKELRAKLESQTKLNRLAQGEK